MKTIPIIIFLFCTKTFLFGQDSTHKYDAILSRALERNIVHPFDYNGGVVGVNIIKISKKDSLLVFKSLFTTDKKFEILDYQRVIKDVNRRCSKLVESPLELIIPIWFQYGDDRLTSDDQIKVDKKINHLKKKGKIISSFPISIVKFEIVR